MLKILISLVIIILGIILFAHSYKVKKKIEKEKLDINPKKIFLFKILGLIVILFGLMYLQNSILIFYSFI